MEFVNEIKSDSDLSVLKLIKFIELSQINCFKTSFLSDEKDHAHNQISSTNGSVLFCTPQAKYCVKYRQLKFDISDESEMSS